MADPLLSICIPTHDRADWLDRCLDSCLPQAEALPDGLAEVVVSDNASTDRTPALLAGRAARHPALRVHRNAVNNCSANFDTVLQCARGRYGWLLGDDDALLPGAVARVAELIRCEPRDFYLAHVVLDSGDPAVRRMAWFRELPRLDWNLSDPAELQEYMEHGCSASAVFSFISVLIFLREPWLEAAAARPPAFAGGPWPQVATGLEYVKRHGRLRVIPEPLVNYHCSTGAWGEPPWDRAMLDLRGLLQVADAFFPDRPELFRAFMGNLRRNHGDGWIAHHRSTAPNAAAWAESRALLLRAGFDPLKVAAADLGGDLLRQGNAPGPGLDAGGLALADLGFVARGARRTLVLAGPAPEPLEGLLEALRGTRAGFRVLVAQAPGEPVPAEVATRQTVDLVRFAGDHGYRRSLCAALRSFAPDLVVNLDPGRDPGWDLMAAEAGAAAAAAVAYRAPGRAWEATRPGGPYTRLLAPGPVPALVSALGLVRTAAGS